MAQPKSNVYHNRRRLMTRNGITIQANENGTKVTCRQNTAGALYATVPLSTDETAELICDTLRSTQGQTRQQRAAAVIAAVKEHTESC